MLRQTEARTQLPYAPRLQGQQEQAGLRPKAAVQQGQTRGTVQGLRKQQRPPSNHLTLQGCRGSKSKQADAPRLLCSKSEPGVRPQG